MRILKESESTLNKKYSRAYYLYSEISKISVKRAIETTIIDIILRNYLDLIERLFNALIR